MIKKTDNRRDANLQQKKMAGKYCKRVVKYPGKFSHQAFNENSFMFDNVIQEV